MTMARRRQGAALDFLDLVAMLPWWGGVGLALASHALLDRLSVPSPAPMQAGPMGAFVQQALVTAFASIGRWLVPLLCLLGAAVSFMRRRRRRALIGNVTGSDAASAPTCPTCDADMVLRRMARTGARAGASFWGCSRFPACRGTR
jgi:restriction system protein